jgi:uncharacterized YigZ family protein
MTESLDRYRTLAGPGTAEQKIQRSRFLAEAHHAASEEAARALVAAMRRRYHDARHVGVAWRLGAGDQPVEVRQDDGEPSGTTGEPILQAIRAAGLTDTVVMVARYFGGVKLGTGGLARAYGSTAAAAIAAAVPRTVLLGRRLEVVMDYGQQKTVRHLLEGVDGRIEDEDYGPRVTWLIWLPRARADGFAAAVRDASAGRVQVASVD